MNKILTTLASAAVIVIGVGAMSGSASAFLDDNSCKGNKSCSDNSVDNSTVNSGGAGGDGGDAIQGQQQGIFGSGNSDNNNRNYNTNLNSNSQGQGQGQSQTGLNLQGQGQSTDNANNSSQSVYVEGDEASDIPVSSAYAAPLTSADDTCMGSTSAGVQAMGFGISLGSTWRDEDCVRRKDSRMFYNMKMTDVAVARMCQKADNRAAVEAAGSVCPGTEASATPVAAAAELTTVETTTSRSTDWDYLDNDRDHGDN